MQAFPLGSLWSVLGLEDAVVAIIAGPFAAARGTPEYLVAPLYSGKEPGFVWTLEDVRLEPAETGLSEPAFATIWNARPVLQSDLLLQMGRLTDEATIALRDAYWASLNERPLGKSNRLGRRIHSAEDPAARFQARELDRWQPLSGRALTASHNPALVSKATLTPKDVWWVSLRDFERVTRSITEAEGLLGNVQLSYVDASQARFWVQVKPAKMPPSVELPLDLFDQPAESLPSLETEPRISTSLAGTELSAEVPDSDLANAA